MIYAHFRDRAERGEAGGGPEVVRREIVDNVLVDFRFYLLILDNSNVCYLFEASYIKMLEMPNKNSEQLFL